jgi:hypothetical protein
MTNTSESEQILRGLSCPACGMVGSLRLGEVLVASPLGTWSLSGAQLKTPAVLTSALVCTMRKCTFYKLPSHAHHRVEEKGA